MKTLASLVLLVLVWSTAAYSQPDTTHLVRHADSLTTFFIGSTGPFDKWPYREDSNHNVFGTMSMPDTAYRFYNLDDTLGMNGMDRSFWDYPGFRPASKDDVLKNAGAYKVLILEPQQLFTAFDNAQYLRYEFERHTQMVADSEYLGFLYYAGLTGRNQKVAGATFPAFLKGSGRDADTNYNAVALDKSIDSPGVFADSMWHPGVWSPVDDHTATYCPTWFDRQNSNKMMLRIRVKVNQSVTGTPILFTVTRTEANSGDSLYLSLRHIDTIYVDTNFRHVNHDFDTILVHFRRNSSTQKIHFSFSWPGTVNAIFDYMELMTEHINPSDTGLGNIGYPTVALGEASAYSGQDFVDSIPTELGKLISTIKKNYQGHVTFLRIGDEFPMAEGLPFKRLVKLVRDSTGGQIEVCPFTVDSTGTGWFGTSLPYAHVFNFEGARKGWVDTSRYADPKMLFFDPYIISTHIPLPKRTSLTDPILFKNWENSFLPVTYSSGVVSLEHYTRDRYQLQTQYKEYVQYLDANRHLRRWTERQNNGSHFGIDWQAGAAVSVVVDSGHLFLGFTGLRPPTGPEMKVTGNLSTSCGALGLILYNLSNPGEYAQGWEDGGIMNSTGSHDSMYYTTSASDKSGDTTRGRVWMGFHERYDSVRSLMPSLIKYGTTLLHAKCVGDWLASELFLTDTNTKKILLFIDTSVRAQDDSTRLDKYLPTRSTTPPYVPEDIYMHSVIADTANRTFVHISMWLDTNSAAKALGQDTMLYITNMRTDDSYDTSGKPSTIDRRLITLRMKRPHVILDVLDTNGGQLDDGRIWTPYVGVQSGDSLRLFLNAGDGILVRLMDTLAGTPMLPTRIAMTFPKGTLDFNDKGRIQFDKYVPGVRNKTSDWSIPSSHLAYTVGISNVDTTRLWQDSLLYLRVDTVTNSRSGQWRQQDWHDGSTAKFNFKNTLSPSFASRQAQISTDSLAHNIVIKTDLENAGSSGKIRVKDPFLVDSATLKNVQDTLAKSSPFLPHVLNIHRGQGVDSEHYGGIFLLQNPRRLSGIPIYALNAFSTIQTPTFASKDTVPRFADWSFLEWTSNDTTVSGDTLVWLKDIDSSRILFSKNPGIIFGKDSAQYIARYKAHMAAFIDSYNASDSGNCCNNQRKLYNMGTDSIGRKMFRFVYSSDGRIYTAVGTRTGTNDGDIIWKPEQLLSSWTNHYSHYPSVGYHPARSEKYHFAYEEDSTLKIKLAMLDSNGMSLAVNISDLDDYTFATPSIASTDFIFTPLDVVAWATANSGIHIRAVLWNGGSPTLSSSIPLLGIGKHARYPSVWMDSDYTIGTYAQARLWVAWQQDTLITYSITCCDVHGDTIHHDSVITDVFAAQFIVSDNMGSAPTFTFLGQTDVSRRLNPFSLQNQRPCIAGYDYMAGGSVWQRIKLAYEALYKPDSTRHQGIEIANHESGGSWTNTNFLTSLDTTNPYWKPSIELSQYHKADTGLVTHYHWYSLAHERAKGVNIAQWAFDTATVRVSHLYSGLQDPQVAVTPTKIDSDLYRMALSNAGGTPRSLLSGYQGTFKLGADDSLWGYHSLLEKDTGSALMIESGIGELAIDNGNGFSEFDLQGTDALLKVDSLHSKESFMQSAVFTLPSGGSFRYCPWINPSNDSLMQSRFGSLKYAVDFYDTTGVFKYRIDSMTICDTIPRIHCDLRTVSINTNSNLKGYALFHRVTGLMDDTSAIPQSIISTARLSTAEEDAYKRAGENKPQASGISDITLTTSPNPFKNEVNVYLKIPYSAPVTIEAFNALGNSMGYLCQNRMFTDGTHELVWKAGKLPSGVYILRMQYGNEVISARVVAME